jgi:hypothetical protein
LFAVLGATLGPFLGLEVQLLAYSLLLMFALCLLTYQGRLLQTLRNAADLLLRRAANLQTTCDAPALTTLRLGPAIFVAAVLLALHTHLSWQAL